MRNYLKCNGLCFNLPSAKKTNYRNWRVCPTCKISYSSSEFFCLCCGDYLGSDGYFAHIREYYRIILPYRAHSRFLKKLKRDYHLDTIERFEAACDSKICGESIIGIWFHRIERELERHHQDQFLACFRDPNILRYEEFVYEMHRIQGIYHLDDLPEVKQLRQKFRKYNQRLKFQKLTEKLNKEYNRDDFWAALSYWSVSVKKNTGGLCWCGEKAKESHHLFYRSIMPKLALNLNNGIALCKNHHYEVHGKKISGVKYYNYPKFFQF